MDAERFEQNGDSNELRDALSVSPCCFALTEVTRVTSSAHWTTSGPERVVPTLTVGLPGTETECRATRRRVPETAPRDRSTSGLERTRF